MSFRLEQEWSNVAKIQSAYECGDREAKAAACLATEVEPSVIDKLHKMVLHPSQYGPVHLFKDLLASTWLQIADCPPTKAIQHAEVLAARRHCQRLFQSLVQLGAWRLQSLGKCFTEHPPTHGAFS